MTANCNDNRTAPFVTKMATAGQPDLAARVFCHHFNQLLAGLTGNLDRSQIEPLDSLPDATTFSHHAGSGEATLAKTVVIKLNGGLGTSMGLEQAKSLLPVRENHSFLDLIALQVGSLSKRAGRQVPLVLMNSFRTEADSETALRAHATLAASGIPLGFRQHQIPKIAIDGMVPVQHPAAPELEWCPPGHGDIYPALLTSKVLETLLSSGIEYAFISNADNLGAVLDPSILGYMVDHELNFVMEAADRTAADRKGGHLCALSDHRLGLRELAQCPTDEADEFQDIELYRYFNTNSIWLHLPTLNTLLHEHQGVLPLATILNRKTVDPRDPSSAAVIQLETAVGSALAIFPRAAAVRVARHRFSPVKTCNDLLSVRSDAYLLDPEFCLRLHPDRDTPPTVRLADQFYRTIDDLDRRFPAGPPSLLRCSELTVEGDTTFGAEIEIHGRVRIPADCSFVEDRTILEG